MGIVGDTICLKDVVSPNLDLEVRIVECSDRLVGGKRSWEGDSGPTWRMTRAGCCRLRLGPAALATEVLEDREGRIACETNNELVVLVDSAVGGTVKVRALFGRLTLTTCSSETEQDEHRD